MLHVEQIKWFGTKNTTSEYYSGIIKEEDWWYELCNLCCHHRMGWLHLPWWNRGRQIPIFKASRKVDVLVATKMNISSIGVHSLMRVWNGWEKANMNTCHFGGEIKADSSTDIAWDGGTSYQDNSIGKMHKVQERRCWRRSIPQKKEKPSSCVAKIKALLKGWLGGISLHWSFIVFDVFTFY